MRTRVYLNSPFLPCTLAGFRSLEGLLSSSKTGRCCNIFRRVQLLLIGRVSVRGLARAWDLLWGPDDGAREGSSLREVCPVPSPSKKTALRYLLAPRRGRPHL